MFTWICPQCGREVPPSYSECPTCAENAKRAAAGLPPLGAEPEAAPPPPQQPQAPMQPMQPMAEWQPQQPMGGAQPVYVLPGTVPSNKRLPTWLMVPGFAVLIIAVLFGIYRMVGGKTDFTPASTKSESAPAAVSTSSNPYAKFIEVAGVRVNEDAKQKARVQMVVVNHSSADLPELELRVTLRTVNAKEGDEPLAVVKTKIAKIEANGLKEVTEPLTTKLRAYELPDWQFLRAEVEVVSPK